MVMGTALGLLRVSASGSRAVGDRVTMTKESSENGAIIFYCMNCSEYVG